MTAEILGPRMPAPQNTATIIKPPSVFLSLIKDQPCRLISENDCCSYSTQGAAFCQPVSLLLYFNLHWFCFLIRHTLDYVSVSRGKGLENSDSWKGENIRKTQRVHSKVMGIENLLLVSTKGLQSYRGAFWNGSLVSDDSSQGSTRRVWWSRPYPSYGQQSNRALSLVLHGPKLRMAFRWLNSFKNKTR